jgi:hypothetical protein
MTSNVNRDGSGGGRGHDIGTGIGRCNGEVKVHAN